MAIKYNDANLAYVVQALKADGFSALEAAAFLAQVHHESQGFTRLVEYNWSGKRAYEVFPRKFASLGAALNIYSARGSAGIFNVIYNGVNGNIPNSNDGYDFRGRAWIQATGRDNYEPGLDWVGIDLLKYPDRLAERDVATKFSIEWWKHKVRPRINGDFANVYAITGIVNGRRRLGLTERTELFAFYRKNLNV